MNVNVYNPPTLKKKQTKKTQYKQSDWLYIFKSICHYLFYMYKKIQDTCVPCYNSISTPIPPANLELMRAFKNTACTLPLSSCCSIKLLFFLKQDLLWNLYTFFKSVKHGFVPLTTLYENHIIGFGERKFNFIPVQIQDFYILFLITDQ